MAKRKTEVERVAETIERETKAARPGCDCDTCATTFMAACRLIARWHLAAVRKARGRTVGWLVMYRDERVKRLGSRIHTCCDEPVNVRLTHLMGKDVARVVLVPRRKR